MKKVGLMILGVLVGLSGLYFLVMQPSLGMTKRLEELQNEEYAYGCKEASSDAIATAAAKPSVTKSNERDPKAVAAYQGEEIVGGEGIHCRETASRANLIAIDSLRMASFTGVVAYLLGFGSLISILASLQSSNGAVSTGSNIEGIVALRTATIGVDHATLTMINVGSAAMWLRGIHVNNDVPAIFGGACGPILCMQPGDTHAVSAHVRDAYRTNLGAIYVEYAQISGKRQKMHATLIYDRGDWQVKEVHYYDE